jgi:hypothetical protein
MKNQMKTACAFAICVLSVTVQAQRTQPEDFSRYRTFELGSSLAAVSTSAGAKASDARTIHQRPAVIQDLAWRPSHWSTDPASLAPNDPVEQVVFNFYNDQLFRIVVDYSRDRTEGMTASDLIESISQVYGTPVKMPTAPRVASKVENESGSPLARWGENGRAVVLYKTSTFHDAFRLIVMSPSLEDLAQKAAAQAIRLDEQEAPQREIARAKKEHDDGAVAAEKARLANKKVFWP